MKKIESFDKNNLTEMRIAINEALARVSENYNVDFKIGRISYESLGFSAKIDASLVIDGKTHTKESRDFLSLAEMYGCEFPLGFKFDYNGVDYIVDGFKPRSRKFPVLATNQDTKASYKFPIDSINMRFNAKKVVEKIGTNRK
tara:strand:- start:418 stop:846 length:429 start_codon:yes stop_codon:yes gene_type:complete